MSTTVVASKNVDGLPPDADPWREPTGLRRDVARAGSRAFRSSHWLADLISERRPCRITRGLAIHRFVVISVNSFECLWNMAIRLLVNSAMIPGNSTGDLIVANV